MVDDLISRPCSILVRIEIKAPHGEVLELLKGPPGIWHFLKFVLGAEEELLGHFVEAWLTAHFQRDVQRAWVSNDELERSLCVLLQRLWNCVVVFLERNDINEIKTAHKTAGEITSWELWHVIAKVRSIELGVLLLKIIDFFLGWLL